MLHVQEGKQRVIISYLAFKLVIRLVDHCSEDGGPYYGSVHLE